jgi:hypothetical protein
MARKGYLLSSYIAIAISCVVAQNSNNAPHDILDYVDQLIGSSNGGWEFLTYSMIVES